MPLALVHSLTLVRRQDPVAGDVDRWGSGDDYCPSQVQPARAVLDLWPLLLSDMRLASVTTEHDKLDKQDLGGKK